MLARSPREFAKCANVRRFKKLDTSVFSMTNKGLHIHLPLIHSPSDFEDDLFLAVLSCQDKGEWEPHPLPLGIHLRRIQGEGSANYVRVHTNTIGEIGTEFSFSFEDKHEIYIKESNPSRFDVSQWMQPQNQYTFMLKCPQGLPRLESMDNIKWDMSKEIRITFPGSGHSVTLVFKDNSGQIIAVNLGVHNYNVWCDLATDIQHDDVKAIAKEYWDGARSGRRWDNMDRVVGSLPGGKSVSLAVKKGIVSGKRGYLVVIDADGDFWFDRAGPGTYPGW